MSARRRNNRLPPRVAALLALAICSTLGPVLADTLVDRAKRDEITLVEDDDRAMKKAFERARSTLDQFLTLSDSHPAHLANFAVKVGIGGGGEVEYFWITPFSRSGDAFTGRLDSEPQLVNSVQMGQEFQFKRSQIVDWTYMDRENRRMVGNYTACALLAHESKDDAEQFMSEFGLTCEPL